VQDGSTSVGNAGVAATLALLNIKVPRNACPTDRSGGVIAWFIFLMKWSTAEFAQSIKKK
jgi:hypothetical protein